MKKYQATGVIYPRYSSRAQRDVSIEQQIKACEEFARQHDIKIIKTYPERAMSGTNDRRPQFQKMISEASTLDYQYVIVYSLDRFARDRYDSAVYKRQLKQCGKRVLSVTENISDDPSGVLMESMLEGLAEYYSKELSRKIRRGMSDNAEKCMANGPMPLGYRRGSDGRYEIVESEAKIVREIYQRVSSHEPLIEIIHDLNDRGVLTKQRKQWNRSSFNKLLSNERYTGVYIFGDTRIEDGIPAIVDRTLYDSVQFALTHKSNPRNNVRRRRQADGLYLLTGKLFCGHCESPLVGVSGTGKRGTQYYYYVCKKKREKLCDKRPVSRDLIEQKIAQAIKDNMLTPEMIEVIARETIKYYEKINDHSDELSDLKSELTDVNSAASNVMAAIEQGIITEMTKSRLLELEERSRSLKQKIAAIEESSKMTLSYEDIIATLYLYKDCDIDDKAMQESLFNAFLVRAYVFDDKLKIIFNSNTTTDIEVPIEVTESDSAECSYNVGLSSTKVFYTNTAEIIFIQGFFVIRCPL